MNETDKGYVIFERLLERSEIMAALRGLEQAAITRSKAGARHVLSVPVVRHLATDSRLIQVASRFVGPHAVPFRATLFDKSHASNWLVVWHQDAALPLRGRIELHRVGPWSTKSGVVYAHAPAWALASVIALRVHLGDRRQLLLPANSIVVDHLDDSTHTDGPLRVLPDTHTAGVLGDDEIERLAAEIEALPEFRLFDEPQEDVKFFTKSLAVKKNGRGDGSTRGRSSANTIPPNFAKDGIWEGG